MGLLDLEEVVGRCWHRWAGAAASYPSYPAAAATLDSLRPRLAVFFRGLGGPGGIRLAAAGATGSRHRLNLRQRLGLGGEERMPQASLDHESLLLPPRIELFPDAGLNQRLYFWLAAYFAHVPLPEDPLTPDPLQADLRALRVAHRTSRAILRGFPGLAADHAALGAALRANRPQRRLTESEAAVEETVLHLLGGAAPTSEAGRAVLAAVCAPQFDPQLTADRDHRPFLPVPLWGELRAPVRARPSTSRQEVPGGGSAENESERLAAERLKSDAGKDRDPLLLNRFEHLLSLAEMVNLNRGVEDEDPDVARQTSRQLDRISLGDHHTPAKSRLKLDLALAPAAADTTPVQAEYSYPEWDFMRQTYHRAHCRVIAETAEVRGEDWTPDAAARRRIRAVRRQFEALRPRRMVFPAQTEGEELDLEAVVRARADARAGGAGSERVYTQSRNGARDLAVAVLVDTSLSTDSWVGNRRVLDVEKEAVLALMHGLEACGDTHAVFTFSSRKRSCVNVRTVKGFHEPLDRAIRRRLEAVRPGYYTRIGAALRHVAGRLAEQPNRHRLLLLLTDGKPNDFDHYEGRYGVEDTRKAVREARGDGLAVFGITVDSKARDYFPYLFGRGAYAMVRNIDRLPAALPAIYRQITAT